MKLVLMLGLLFVPISSCNENNTANLNSKSDSILNRTTLIADSLKDGGKAAINKPASHTTLDSLQGTWISGKDNNDYIVIQAHSYYEIYKGDAANKNDTTLSKILFADTCIDDSPSFADVSKLDGKRENGEYFVLADVKDTSLNLCYHIDGVDNENLSLTYHGKMLDFRKKK